MAQPNEVIIAALENVGVPYRYRIFKGKEIPAPPFITYYIERERFYGADEYNGLKKSTIVIELYTASKDFELEACIEAELAGNKFDKTEEFDDADEVYRITYATELTLKI